MLRARYFNFNQPAVRAMQLPSRSAFLWRDIPVESTRGAGVS